MEMIFGETIAAAELADWRKLAQGLHARFVPGTFTAGARFVAAVGEASDRADHHPEISLGHLYVDLKLVSHDAIYREDDGTEHVVGWVTEKDLDLARTISALAQEHGLIPEPSAVAELELGLDVSSSGTIAPFWALLLTGDPEAQGRGTPGDEVRDASARVPNLWFDDLKEDAGVQQQRFHVEVYLPPEVVQERIAALVAAGGTVVDDSQAPMLTVVADQDGNRGIICADTSAAV